MKQWWRHLPRIKYNPPPAGADDFFSKTFKELEQCFKFVGWCIVIGTLHYGTVKTQSVYFAVPEAFLTSMLVFLVYGYFTRFSIILTKREIVFQYSRPFSWPSAVAAVLGTAGARVLINHWVDAVLSLQAK